MTWNKLKGTPAWKSFISNSVIVFYEDVPLFDIDRLNIYYNFFDSHGILVYVYPQDEISPWGYSIKDPELNFETGCRFKTRHEAEKEAFFKGFEILNERLKPKTQIYMKTEQDIKNKWMELSGLPIISDDEKHAYISWLEDEHLKALKNVL